MRSSRFFRVRSSVRSGLLLLAVLVASVAVPALAAKEPPRKAGPPTYTKDVSPILQKNCQNCHRRGQVGPVRAGDLRAGPQAGDDIAAVAGDRSMPPWKPVAGGGPELKHDPSLTAAEIAVLVAWAEAGAPKGEDTGQPRPPEVRRRLGAGHARPRPRDARGLRRPRLGPGHLPLLRDPHQPARDAYISAVEYRPGNRRVVHHVMAFLDTSGAGRQRDDGRPRAGLYVLLGPGRRGPRRPRRLGGRQRARVTCPRASAVRCRPLRRHPPGPLPPQRQARDRPLAAGDLLLQEAGQADPPLGQRDQQQFRLPPGKSDIEVKATWNVPVDVEALGVTPHMHQLGRDIRMTRHLPRRPHPGPDPDRRLGSQLAEHLLLREARLLAQGLDREGHRPLRQLRASPQPAQPAEARQVGPEVTDEMCVGFIGVVKKGQDLTRPGEKDDLFEILTKQYYHKMRSEEAARSRR